MTESVKVSIIVPIYNCAEYLPRCLDSLVNQTLAPLEIILVNDGSTDASPAICRTYAANHSNIILLNQSNGGAAKARIEGEKIATGEYLAFVDGDDWTDQRMFATLYEIARRNNADISQCSYFQTDGSSDGRECDCGDIQTVTIHSAREALMQLFGCRPGREFNFMLWGKLFRRELFAAISFPAYPHQINDVPAIARLFGAARTIASVDGKLYYYFSRGNTGNPSTMDQLHSQQSKFIQSHIEAFDDVSNYYREVDRELYLASLRHTVSWSLSTLIRRNMSPECRLRAVKAIKSAQLYGNPLRPRNKKIIGFILQMIFSMRKS